MIQLGIDKKIFDNNVIDESLITLFRAGAKSYLLTTLNGWQKNMTKITTKETFSTDVLSESKLVLVDFWAEWCGPCKQIAPRLEELAEKYSENLSVCKVDVDSNRELALEYNVRSIPSLILFNGGEQVDTLIGAVSFEELEDLITRNL